MVVVLTDLNGILLVTYDYGTFTTLNIRVATWLPCVTRHPHTLSQPLNEYGTFRVYLHRISQSLVWGPIDMALTWH